MREIIIIIGSLIISLLLVAVPALCIASFILNWDTALKFILTVLTIVECVLILILLVKNNLYE